jgi:hypothetical protein
MTIAIRRRGVAAQEVTPEEGRRPIASQQRHGRRRVTAITKTAIAQLRRAFRLNAPCGLKHQSA